MCGTKTLTFSIGSIVLWREINISIDTCNRHLKVVDHYIWQMCPTGNLSFYSMCQPLNKLILYILRISAHFLKNISPYLHIVILHSTQVIGAVWTVRIVTRFHFMQPIRTIAERTTGQRRPHSQTLSVLHGQPVLAFWAPEQCILIHF